jgi:YVTN family beta-propeller protein
MLSQTDAKHRLGRARRIAAAALGAVALALVGASAASAEETAYISNAAKGRNVTSINLKSKTEKEISVTAPTSSIAITHKEGTKGKLVAYAPEFEGLSLIPINLETNQEEPPLISLGKNPEKPEPEDVAVTPNGLFVYVADEETNNVKVVKVSNNEVVYTLEKFGTEPEGIAFSANGSFAYVADKETEHQGKVSVFNNASLETEKVEPALVGNINIGTEKECRETELSTNPAGDCLEPEKIAVATIAGKELFYVADGAAGTVTVVEHPSEPTKAKTVATIKVGGAELGGTEPSNIVIDGTEKAYVTLGTANGVCVINLKNNTVEASIGGVGLEPHGLALAAAEKLVVVTDEENKETEDVRTINTTSNTVAEKFSVKGVPDGVAIH